jgi:hypothetical protein
VSTVSDAATVRLLIGDFVAVDALSSKLSVVGGGVTVLGLATGGNTAPFGVYVSVTVPPAQYGESSHVELVLEEAGGAPAEVPSLPDGMPKPLRMGQDVAFHEPKLPGSDSIKMFLPARAQLAIGFPIGLPLEPTRGYRWRVVIDGDTRDDWTESFIVIAASAEQSS